MILDITCGYYAVAGRIIASYVSRYNSTLLDLDEKINYNLKDYFADVVELVDLPAGRQARRSQKQ